MKKVLIGMLAAVGLLSFVGWNTLPNDDTSIPGPTIFGKRVDIGQSQLYIGGTQVTANAANLNSGVVSSTASLVSNATLKVYGKDLVIVAGGSISAPAGSVSAATLATNLLGACVITNAAPGITNVCYYDARGLLTNRVLNP